MTARSILQIFDQYQRARMSFVQTIADLAARPQNVEYLNQAGCIELVQPLLSDICIQIRQCAAIAMGRFVYCDSKLAKQVLNRGLLPTLLRDIDKQNKYYKKAALFVVRSLCRHDEEITSIVVNNGGLEALVMCLEDFEPTVCIEYLPESFLAIVRAIVNKDPVKEEAAWAIGYIAKHGQHLAQNVVDIGAVSLLMLCMQEPELHLKQISVNALSDIAKHNMDLAQSIVDAGAVPHLARTLNNQDEKLKRIILTALGSIAKHSDDLAEVVVEAEIFPSVLIHMSHACPIVRKNAAALVRDVIKHSLELTQLVVNVGGISALMETLRQPSEESKIPCITALGYIAGHSDQLAMSVLGCNGVQELTKILIKSDDDTTLAVAAWALGHIGKHSSEHTKAIATANAFPRLLELYNNRNSSEDLKFKIKTTLKQCLQKCMLLSALEPLLYTAPPNILKYILGQFSKETPGLLMQNPVLCTNLRYYRSDPKARRLFVTSGGLKKIQEIETEPGSVLMEYVTVINSCFPEEIVRYYSPGYPETLLEAVEQYSPQVMTILREVKHRNSDVQANFSPVMEETTSQQLQSLFES